MSELPARAPRKGALGDPKRIRVLMYHRILSDGQRGDPHQLCLPEQQFRRQIELLDRWGYTPITFEDFRLFAEGELNLPAKPVIITFDDGYSETFTTAFPLLQEFGMRAVVFVVADPGVRTSVWDSEHPAAVTPLLSQEQILELHAAGFEIGSHTLDHRNLCELEREAAWEEISRSRMLLEILLNSPVRSFAYPFGLLNEKVKQMVREAGYSIACSGWTGPALFGDDAYEIRRIVVLSRRSLGTLSFAWRLFAPYQIYRWLLWRLRVALEGAGVRRTHPHGMRS